MLAGKRIFLTEPTQRRKAHSFVVELPSTTVLVAFELATVVVCSAAVQESRGWTPREVQVVEARSGRVVVPWSARGRCVDASWPARSSPGNYRAERVAVESAAHTFRVHVRHGSDDGYKAGLAIFRAVGIDDKSNGSSSAEVPQSPLALADAIVASSPLSASLLAGTLTFGSRTAWETADLARRACVAVNAGDVALTTALLDAVSSVLRIDCWHDAIFLLFCTLRIYNIGRSRGRGRRSWGDAAAQPRCAAAADCVASRPP